MTQTRVLPTSAILIVEPGLTNDPAAYVSQFGLEAMVQATPAADVSQFGLEALVQGTSAAYVSQFGLEVLVKLAGSGGGAGNSFAIIIL